ncbi:putative isomerase [Bryocella elongata]|uniref:Putative isomerase n=1 Tax=Bryocella elongata TaxID=863522 RepID=A0A1H5TRT4_9BACT|nr:trehalase family glycosidase [Bryocella elongata]SEF65494.1 putative isomerase [Bryocella elongata]
MNRRDLLRCLSFAGASSVAATSFAAGPEASEDDATLLLRYFTLHARDLLRKPAGVLRFPSIAPSLPGATYSADLWDWDTLWTARGLFEVADRTKDAGLSSEVAQHAQGSLANFFDHQSSEGRVPMLITMKDADPLGCLKGSRPHKENQAKPVLAQLALLAADRGPKEMRDARWFEPSLARLRRFYDSWRADNLSHTGLLVWGDDVAIGNDNDPTTFGRPFFSSANLLLNCLYYQDLKAAAELSRRTGHSTDGEQYEREAAALVRAIQQHCWDPRDRFFYTADVQCADRRAELIHGIPLGMAMSWSSLPLRLQTFTGFLPMWAGICTEDQNRALAEHLRNQRGLGASYGVRTLSAAEPMYSLAASSNPSNWLGPVWIIANYLTWSGLVRAGFREQANAMASATISMLARDLRRSGSLNEYYHPDRGEPLSHAGFMDWNLLVLEMLPQHG